jgi:thiamine biosynthesis lipoprotein
MGTVFSVEVEGDRASDALDRVFAWFHRVDEVFSPYRDSSAVTRLGRGACELGDCPPDVAAVLQACENIRLRTNGAFDARSDPRWPLDPSAYVKGWSAEVASGLLTGAGFERHCINAGGDVRVRSAIGRPPWRVGIAHPFLAGEIAAAVDLRNGAVATSGTYERGAHVWDPRSGRAALDLASVTVVGPDLGLADAYATAALAMGPGAPAWLDELEDHEALVVTADGDPWWTDGFAAIAIGLPLAR